MRRLGGHWRSLVAIALVALTWPAFGAGFDCSRTTDRVEKAICANPAALALDTRLAGAYSAALTRDPARAVALKRDQQNWLGERDDLAWRLLNDPETASAAVKGLRRLYLERIAFLASLDDSHLLSDSSLADKLLAAVRALPRGTSNVLQALQSQGLVALPQQRQFSSVAAVVAALPAPPASSLRKALEQYPGVSNFTLAYLRSANLGGIFNVEGTAGCRYWVVFEKSGTHTVLDGNPPGQELGGCWNSVGHLALMDGRPVAINETDGITSQETDLQWRRYEEGKWSAPMHVRIRFDRVLSPGFAGCASGVDCAAARQLALRYARLYDRRPLPSTLLHVAALAPVERSRFLRMLAFAEGAGMDSGPVSETALSEEEFQQRWAVLEAQALRTGKIQTRDVVMELPFANHGIQFAAPRFGPEPPVGSFQPASTFFPARVGGQLVLGRIGHGQIGWRQYSPWMVGFWRWKGGKLVPIAGVDVDRQNGEVLFAARIHDAPLPQSP